ncbi:MAG: S8 family peptidase, partial [Thermoplasmata archaeon]|nr:S8 family peptidase [Thermoplasmata archaeon]
MKKHAIIGLTLLLLLSAVPFFVAASSQARIPVIIMFKQKQDLGLVRAVGGHIKTTYSFQPAVAAVIPERALEALERNPAIEFVVRDLPIELVGQSTPWGVERIGAPAVHTSGNKGAGANVAILDTGIDTDHPDLSYIYGYDFSGGNDPGPEDFDGHGTHVAGTVAALDNTIGVVGVAPEANLYILTIFTDGGSGSYSDALEALEWCIGTYSDVTTGNEIQVISMSWGSNVEYGDPGIEQWIDEAYSLGILLVGAAGNEGNPPGRGDNVIYPARYENVVAVAATDESDGRARWSSTGPAVELSAPGVNILSTYLGGGYAYGSGTSMACPHVSGTAALVLASDETFWGLSEYTNADGGWTNVEVRTVLDRTAYDLGKTGRDEKYGYGLVDADEAAGTSAAPPPPPPPGGTLRVDSIK